MSRRDRDALFGGAGSRFNNNSYASDDSANEEDSFLSKQLQHHEDQRAKQDKSLDILHDTIHRVGAASKAIGDELSLHTDMLDDMDAELMKSQSSMDIVNKHTKELIKLSGGDRMFCFIVALSCIAFILFLLVIYT